MASMPVDLPFWEQVHAFWRRRRSGVSAASYTTGYVTGSTRRQAERRQAGTGSRPRASSTRSG
ncbi:hypothetical protein C7C46_04520 [Streptomyces tateyamensis]|uniref:Uncharacterized protein n=1 Tax=Streptomyces tateyamensis TaxID=565073 RepID=A0A2V4P9M5_9ACTN|nr:hypothetical protein C7C46_04520 [Streptomyces tateyamensis]